MYSAVSSQCSARKDSMSSAIIQSACSRTNQAFYRELLVRGLISCKAKLACQHSNPGVRVIYQVPDLPPRLRGIPPSSRAIAVRFCAAAVLIHFPKRRLWYCCRAADQGRLCSPPKLSQRCLRGKTAVIFRKGIDKQRYCLRPLESAGTFDDPWENASPQYIEFHAHHRGQRSIKFSKTCRSALFWDIAPSAELEISDSNRATLDANFEPILRLPPAITSWTSIRHSEVHFSTNCVLHLPNALLS